MKWENVVFKSRLAPYFDLKLKGFLGQFLLFENFLGKLIFHRFSRSFDKGLISNIFLTLF